MKHLEDVPLMEDTYEDPRKKYHPVPAKAIEILIKQGWITFPIPPEQEWGLRLLQRVWADDHKTFLRLMLAELDREERVLLAEYPRYTKIERFVLRMLLGVEQLVEDQTGEPIEKKKYSTEDVQGIVKRYFGQFISPEDVKRLRQAAYDYRRKKNLKEEAKGRLLQALYATK